MVWEKTGRQVLANGESTTFYEATDGRFRIESRKRAIPHAGGSGCWMYTSYFLIWDGGNEKEYRSLSDAKKAAEGME